MTGDSALSQCLLIVMAIAPSTPIRPLTGKKCAANEFADADAYADIRCSQSNSMIIYMFCGSRLAHMPAGKDAAQVLPSPHFAVSTEGAVK